MKKYELVAVLNAKNNASKDLQKFGGDVDSAKQRFEKLTNALKVGISVAAATVSALAVAGIRSAAQFEQSGIAFKTLLGDTEKAQAALKEIEKSAKITPFNLPDLIKANQLLISAGVSAQDANQTILNLGDAISATGGGTDELNRLAVNLQQIRATGQATALDIKQFAFAGINIYQLLADVTGKNVDQVKDMKVTYELLTKAFAQASSEGGRFHNAMQDQSLSAQGLKSNLEDVVSIMLKDIAVSTGLFDAYKNVIAQALKFAETHKQDVINAINKTVEAIKGIREDIKKFVDFLSNHKTATLGFFIGLSTVILFNAVPAVIALTVQFGLMMLSIAPLIVAGGGLALLFELLDRFTKATTGFTLFEQAVAMIDLLTGSSEAALKAYRDLVNELKQRFDIVGQVRATVDLAKLNLSNVAESTGGFVKNLIPFQHGGVVTRPTAGIIGEKEPEAVIPLSKMGSVGGGGLTINVQGLVPLSSGQRKEVAEMLYAELRKVAQSNGLSVSQYFG